MTDWLRQLIVWFSAPDPALVQAGAGGERLVAWTRLGFWLFVGLAPLSGVLIQGLEAPPELLLSLAGVGVAVVFSVGVLVFLRDQRPRPHAGFLTGTFDISVLSATLVAIALAGRAEQVIHSQAAWAVYILIIMTSCLRFDLRVCLFMGLMAIAQYLLVVTWVVLGLGVPLPIYDLLIQIARVLLLIAAAALGMGIINRTRGLIRASGFDRLTGLANRAYFNERLRAEVSRAVREQAPLSLVLFDIDHFKRFNDRHGHAAGDAALRRVAEVILHEKREQDFAARWGGEELALIVPGTDREGTVQAARRIGDRVREQALDVGTAEASLTLSAGIATLGHDGDSPDALFAAADRRVYRAKALGRDQIVFDE